MKPSNRDELVELMARHFQVRGWQILNYEEPKWEDLSADDRAPYIEDAELALTALEQAGCAVVPVEATEEMCTNVNDDVLHADDAPCVYAAMLKAGPYARKE